MLIFAAKRLRIPRMVLYLYSRNEYTKATPDKGRLTAMRLRICGISRAGWEQTHFVSVANGSMEGSETCEDH